MGVHGIAALHVTELRRGPKINEYYRNKGKISPATARAIDLLMTGAVKTQKEAAEAVGLSAVSLGMNIRSAAGIQYINSAHEAIRDKTIDTSVLIDKLSRRAVEVIGDLMEDAQKEDIRLRAAIDLADRGKETAKTQKLQVDSFTVSGRDVASLAEAMVAAAQLRETYAEAATGNYLKAGDSGAEPTG